MSDHNYFANLMKRPTEAAFEVPALMPTREGNGD